MSLVLEILCHLILINSTNVIHSVWSNKIILLHNDVKTLQELTEIKDDYQECIGFNQEDINNFITNLCTYKEKYTHEPGLEPRASCLTYERSTTELSRSIQFCYLIIFSNYPSIVSCGALP